MPWRRTRECHFFGALAPDVATTRAMASRARASADRPAPSAARGVTVEFPAASSRVPRALASSPAPRPPSVLEHEAARAKRHEVFGLITAASGILLALALASYDVRGGRNWCGPVGAALAESLVALIGTASVLVAWSLLVLSVRLFRRTVRPFRLFRALGTAAIIVTIATALHLAFGERPMLGGLASGGLVGVTLGELLRALLGTAGAHLVALTALLVALVVRTRLSVVSMASTARSAGIRSSMAARQGIVTVARAWRQARDEEARADENDQEAPRIVAAEDRTASALADVFAAAESSISVDEEDDAPSAIDSEPGQTSAAVLALLGESERTREEPAPRRAASRRSRAPARPTSEEPASAKAREENSAMLASEPQDSTAETPPDGVVVSRRARRARAASQVPAAPVQPEPTSAPSSVEARTESVEHNEPELVAESERHEEQSAPALQIVTHDEEIEKAMRDASGVGISPEAVESARVGVPRVEHEFVMPSPDLLTAAPKDAVQVDESQLRAAADRLIKTLKDYTIEGRVVEVHPGPVVTTFEFVPAAGTKLAKIARLGDDIAMSLEANRVRIVAPIPGKGRVGFEIPNAKRQTVYFREMIETEAFRSLGGALPVAFGKDVIGAPYYADLATMPHLIVAGATGAGKSVGLNVMLTSLLYKRGPDDVRLLMIDPKMVELAVYDGIPHMLLPVVTDMKKASLALRWVVDEMERRYTLFAQTGSRNIVTFNERVAKAIREGVPLKGLNGSVRPKETGTTMEVPQGEGEVQRTPDTPQPKKLPYILVVVDEFADLMMVAGKEVEAAVARLAQKARAAGIHVILATQRPSVDVITGVIKANFPARVAFKVSQKVDSRTILDQQGAEHLLGRGDMLILPPGSSDLRRVHCAFVSEEEVQAVTDHWRKQGTPTYDEDILRPRDEEGENEAEEPEIKVPMDKYEKAVALVLSSRRCSVSWVQRQLAVGYNVAARMVEKMEREGIVGPPKGPGKDREVLG